MKIVVCADFLIGRKEEGVWGVLGRVLTGLTRGHRERTSVTEICWEWGAKVRMSGNITKEQLGVGG